METMTREQRIKEVERIIRNYKDEGDSKIDVANKLDNALSYGRGRIDGLEFALKIVGGQLNPKSMDDLKKIVEKIDEEILDRMRFDRLLDDAACYVISNKLRP